VAIIAGGIVIPIILYSFIQSINVFSIFYMALTILVISLSPLIFTYEKWSSDIVEKNGAKTLLQIDATVDTGILIFLTLSPIQITETYSSGEEANKSNGNNNIMNPKIVITILTALTLIPFALSAIVIAIWGGEKFWEKEKPKVQNMLNPHNTTGTQVGTAFMIAGFFWLIITMLMLVFIIPYPDYWLKML
ncbi:MAG TPA: hypothetical protein VFK40_12560, partial [Nitrososphaeraceae archaeon]|nr:hypothetical protein [Nitrososphaeraceae archaeon]